jgi:hypothetical protein
MARADELRAQARSLYQLAKKTSQPDESLLHVLHAIELEADADLLERGEIRGAVFPPNVAAQPSARIRSVTHRIPT